MDNNSNGVLNSVSRLESIEKKVCNLPLVFAEMFKDEINANDELRLYNGMKRIVKKYAGDVNATNILNEYTSVISGGASLEEILQVTADEALNPTAVSDIAIDRSCTLGE